MITQHQGKIDRMNRAERIISLLTKELAPSRLEVHDRSSRHAGHAGARPEGETHYDLVIESARFKGLNRVQRHQLIYRLLDGELKNGLHALAIEAYAPGEKT
jgi:BolA protein